MATGTQGTSGSAGTQGKSGQSGMGMSGAGQTGTDNVTYNLVSIIYHALQGAETYELYIQDAEQGGNREMAQFFRQVQQENRQRAEQGFRLLAQCVGPMQQGGGSRSGQHVQSGSQSGQQGGAPSGQSGGQQSQSGGGSMQQGSSGTGSGRGSGSSGGNANR